jgi:hypothetical protein
MKHGDIVQIVDTTHPWFPCLLIVDEVKAWGVQGYVMIPKTNDGSGPTVQAWNRLGLDQIEFVGRAIVALPE